MADRYQMGSVNSKNLDNRRQYLDWRSVYAVDDVRTIDERTERLLRSGKNRRSEYRTDIFKNYSTLYVAYDDSVSYHTVR